MPQSIAARHRRSSLPTPPGAAALGSAGLRTFFRIAQAWNLDAAEQMNLLGLTSRSTYFKWKKEPSGAKLTRDTLERVSYVLGIYKALQILVPNHHEADRWIRKPNAASLFQGGSALE